MKVQQRFRAVLFALIAALLITTAVGAAPKNGGAVVSLSVEQGAFSSSQDVLVKVAISNPTNHTVKVLKWFTPVDGVEESLFAVMRNGEPVAYMGAHYKRPAATGSDYISLRSGESINAVVNLSQYYDFSQSGNYEISYAVAADNLFDEKGNAFKYRDVLTSEKVTVTAEGRAPKRPTPPPPPPPGGNSFNSCTTDQQSLLVTARSNALTYSNDAKSYLNSNTVNSRYTTWFGTYDLNRYGTVNNHFNAIAAAFSTTSTGAGITFDCGCKQNYYAYVYPNEPYTIYLCKVFWQAPATGTDSKAGTLIHEMSHFNVVASTDDWAYGQTNAKSLAISDPNKAIDNADSHEYFAENTPHLP